MLRLLLASTMHLDTIELGADVNKKDKDGNSPLHIVVLEHNFRFLGYCKNKSNTQNVDGYSSLIHELYKYTYYSPCALLLREGANVNTRNNMGQTPLHFAFKHGHFYEAHILLDWGGSMLIPDGEGNTPLDIASSNQSLILMYHIVTMRSANLPLHFHYEFAIPEELILHQKECLEELERIKSIEFGRFSLYDVLLEHGDPVFLSKKREEVDSLLFLNGFPIYCELLRARFDKSMEKLRLLDEAQTCLTMVLPVIIPNEIVRKILSYMCNEDLTNIIKGKK